MTSFIALLSLITKRYRKILDFSIEIRFNFLKTCIVLKVFLKTISIPTTFVANVKKMILTFKMINYCRVMSVGFALKNVPCWWHSQNKRLQKMRSSKQIVSQMLNINCLMFQSLL
jgi:hypothetical protein